MAGKKKSSMGFDPRLKKYKSGRNIIDELTKLNDPRLNKKINSLIDIYHRLCQTIIDVKIENYHYFLTLLLHDKRNNAENSPYIPTKFIKNCLCSYYTSVYRDMLRTEQPRIFNRRKVN